MNAPVHDSANRAAPLLIRNAQVLSLDETGSQWPQADIVIENGVITAIGPGAGDGWPHGGQRHGQQDGAKQAGSQPAGRVIDASGMLAMPGLINAHFHSPGNLLKGTLDSLPLELFMLYEVPPLAQAGDAARLAYVRTMIGALEMLRRGITTVHDDAFHVPIATQESVDAIMQAYADVGIRATVAIDQPNIVEYDKYPFLGELLPENIRRDMQNAPRQSSRELLDLYAHLISRWHGAAGGRLKAAVSCSAPQRVSHDYFAGLSALSKAHDLPFNIHILETKLQRVLGEEKFGKSLVQHVHDLGFLDERMMVIHAIWIDDADIALLAQSGCTVAHNPVCNLRLGSGVMPYYKLRAAGVPICLGSDEATSDDAINMWTVAKTGAMLQTIANPEYRDWPTAPEMLGALTRGGARALRQSNSLGQLKVGYAADIALLDLDTLPFTPYNDLQRQLIFCEDGSSVRITIVAGRVVYEEGAVFGVTGIDEKALRAEARVLADAGRSQFDSAQAAARQLEPYYRAMYLKAASRDVGFSRWVQG